MSLVGNWTLADDGLFYHNALLGEGPMSPWFVCFDDDEHPELVVQDAAATRGQVTRDWAKVLLTLNGINADIIGRVEHSSRAVIRAGQCTTDRMAPSGSCWLEFKSPYPAGLIVHSDGPAWPADRGMPSRRVRSQSVVYTLGIELCHLAEYYSLRSEKIRSLNL